MPVPRLCGGHAADILLVEEHLPAVGIIEPRDVAQQRRFPAAARAEQEEQFARLDAQVDVVEHEVFAEVFAQVADGDGDHWLEENLFLLAACRFVILHRIPVFSGRLLAERGI